MRQHAPSYYSATAGKFRAQSALQGEITADVVVVGGGFTGLSAALHAAETGMDVVLLEANRIGWGASGRNGGQMIPGLRWGALDLAKRFGEDEARRILLLANSAGDLVRELIALHKIDCDLRDGHFHAAAKRAHVEQMKRELDCLERLVDYRLAAVVSEREVTDFVASRIYYGGTIDMNGGHLHPLNYALGLAKAALKANVRIFEGSAVTRIDHGSPVVAYTARGKVKARHAVLACDTAMGDLEPSLGAKTMGIANYNIATAPLSPELAERLIPSGAAVSDSRFVLNYYRMSADHRLIFGGGEKYTQRPPADIASFVRPYFERVFPHLKGVGIDYAWGGTVGVTRNRLPHMGRIGNAFFAHGWSGQGVVITTLAGQLIAEAMRGTAERFDVLANLPNRPFPGGPLLRHPLSVLGLLYYALRDRL